MKFFKKLFEKLMRKHSWVEKERFFISGLQNFSYAVFGDVESLAYDKTNILYICSLYGKIKNVRMLGK